MATPTLLVQNGNIAYLNREGALFARCMQQQSFERILFSSTVKQLAGTDDTWFALVDGSGELFSYNYTNPASHPPYTNFTKVTEIRIANIFTAQNKIYFMDQGGQWYCREYIDSKWGEIKYQDWNKELASGEIPRAFFSNGSACFIVTDKGLWLKTTMPGAAQAKLSRIEPLGKIRVDSIAEIVVGNDHALLRTTDGKLYLANADVEKYNFTGIASNMSVIRIATAGRYSAILAKQGLFTIHAQSSILKFIKQVPIASPAQHLGFAVISGKALVVGDSIYSLETHDLFEQIPLGRKMMATLPPIGGFYPL